MKYIKIYNINDKEYSLEIILYLFNLSLPLLIFSSFLHSIYPTPEYLLLH